jgi:hypothetical protein
MTTPIVLYGVFVASKIGKTGLSPTVNVRAVERSTGTVTTVASGAAAFVIGDGVYGYQVATATPTTHDYLAVFKTTDASVDAQEVQAVWPPLAGAFAVELARLDAAMSSRLAAAAYNAPLDSTATQAAAAAAIAAADMATATAVAALPDALLDDEEVAAGGNGADGAGGGRECWESVVGADGRDDVSGAVSGLLFAAAGE